MNSDWETHVLSDLIALIESGNRPKGGVTESSGTVPSIGGENITKDGRMDYSTIKRIPEAYYSSMKKGHLEHEDVLINKDGAQTGKVAIYCAETPKAAINEHVFLLRAINDQLLQSYLFYILLWEKTQKQIQRVITGSAQPGLSSKFINFVQINIPPISEQYRVAEIHDTVDLTITQTEWLIEKLRAIKSGMLHDLLTRGIGEDGRVRDLENHPEEFKDSDIGLIPEKWTVREISEIAEINSNTLTNSKNPADEIEYLDISSIERPGKIGQTSTTNYSSAPSRARRIVRSGDTIVSTVRPYLRAIAFIECASDNLIASTGFAVLSPKNITHPHFLFQITMSESFIRHLLIRMTGSNYPAVVASDVGDYSFPCPPIDEQKLISKILSSNDLRIATEEAYHRKLTLMKKGLVHDLLAGRVRVKIPKEKNGES